ncbi:uncharacterized protein A4U43_C08F36200 [Asparagus officinalis]|nr:uncharacterized protein A4U43_C08F36200 [Asparagus officinalis]
MAKFFSLNTGGKIPSVGLGTWQAQPGIVEEAIITAVMAGYRHIDCAAFYENEEENKSELKQSTKHNKLELEIGAKIKVQIGTRSQDETHHK